MVRFLKRSYIYLIFAFLYLPIAVLMVYSFNASRSRGVWGGFTLDWYVELFRDRAIMSSLYSTLIIGISSAVIATIIGTLAAMGIHNSRGWQKRLVMNVTYLPVLNPEIVTAISLMILFVFTKIRLGYVTLLLAHIIFVRAAQTAPAEQASLRSGARFGGHTGPGTVESDFAGDYARDCYRLFAGLYLVH